MHWIAQTVEHYIVAWGYWAVILGLFIEDAGVPVPGETILIFSSFVAYQHHQLKLWLIIVCGIAAATSGDNLGYWIGRKGGRPLLERWKHLMRVSSEDIAAGEDLLRRRGPVAIFFARFLPIMRIVAGPLAGVLRMEWRRFALFNFLGACTWVATIAGVGYAFGSRYGALENLLRRANVVLLIVVLMGAAYLWKRHRRQRRPAGSPTLVHAPRAENRERHRRIG